MRDKLHAKELELARQRFPPVHHVNELREHAPDFLEEKKLC